jgi:hypothetical protein
MVFVREKAIQDRRTQRAAFFHYEARPNPDLQHPLKFFRRIIPTVAVAERVSWQVVVVRVTATAAMCQDVIGLPVFSDAAATNMAPTCGFRQDKGSVLRS